MIRRFVRGLDDSALADLTGVDLNEFRESMLDPEFSDVGMFVAEINKQVVGIANAHISPSHPEFCVLRDFKVKTAYWDSVAPLLLEAALSSFTQRNAKGVETCFTGEAERYVSLLKSKGFELTSLDCRMKHDLKNVPPIENSRVYIKKYSEINNPDLIVNLQNEIFKGLIGRPVTKEEFLFWMKNPDFECFVAFFDKKPVASSFCEVKIVKHERHGWIYGLGVLSSCRGKKIGTVLLSAVLSHLKSKGVIYAFVETDYDSYEQRFYESAGFHVVNKIVCLRKVLHHQK